VKEEKRGEGVRGKEERVEIRGGEEGISVEERVYERGRKRGRLEGGRGRGLGEGGKKGWKAVAQTAMLSPCNLPS